MAQFKVIKEGKSSKFENKCVEYLDSGSGNWYVWLQWVRIIWHILRNNMFRSPV